MSATTNPDNGFVKLYRKVWDHPVFVSRLEAAVFAWMFSAAAWRPSICKTKWGIVRLDTGQVLTSERSLATEFEMHPNKVRKVLSRMIQEGMIRRAEGQAHSNAGSIWTIVNYQLYQMVPDIVGEHWEHLGGTSRAHGERS